MDPNLTRDLDTVVARATPEGEGGLAVVRLSGPQALAIASRVFRGAGYGQGSGERARAPTRRRLATASPRAPARAPARTPVPPPAALYTVFSTSQLTPNTKTRKHLP
jgi:hypothetical protein